MIRDKILLEDLAFIGNNVFKQRYFDRSTILVTGATGLIGSLVIKSILYANYSFNSNISIVAIVRDLEKSKKIFGEFIGSSNIKFIIGDLSDDILIDYEVDYIIHTASITASKEMVENPVGVLLTAFESTKNLLEYVRFHTKCKMLYISSMEYYGQVEQGYNNVTEDKLGYIDLSKVRSSYPESKRVCETLCNAYANQYGVNVLSARLAQTFGAGISKSDNRVFAQFAKSVINKLDIILHTDGQSEGNYCYTADAVYAIFLLLMKGAKGQSYNVANDHSSIFNMANMVAKAIGNQEIQVKILLPEDTHKLGYAPTVKLRLNSDKLRGLGWQPKTNLENMYRRMINSWELQE